MRKREGELGGIERVLPIPLQLPLQLQLPLTNITNTTTTTTQIRFSHLIFDSELANPSFRICPTIFSAGERGRLRPAGSFSLFASSTGASW